MSRFIADTSDSDLGNDDGGDRVVTSTIHDNIIILLTNFYNMKNSLQSRS